MAQKFYHKVSVQVAIVSAVALIIVTILTILHQRSSLVATNEQLLRERQKQAEEIQRLETLLTPFRTIALQRYTGPEGEALSKLATQISALDKALNSAQTELASVKVAASYPKLRRIINIRPNGFEVVCTGNRAGAHTETSSPSPVTDFMRQFAESLNSGNRTAALSALDQIITTMPDWPYGHFYKGAVNGDTNDFNKAADLFALVRSVEIVEPEPLLFEALTCSFLGNENSAWLLLDEIKKTRVKPSAVNLLLFPPVCSSNLLNRFHSISAELGMTPISKN